jgi:hypothetical protein
MKYLLVSHRNYRFEFVSANTDSKYGGDEEGDDDDSDNDGEGDSDSDGPPPSKHNDDNDHDSKGNAEETSNKHEGLSSDHQEQEDAKHYSRAAETNGVVFYTTLLPTLI